jgi:pyridoxal phosphate enzyme (YggS family)
MNDRISIAAALDAVTARIRAACAASGRDPASVTLVAVAKTHPAEDVAAALAHGQRVFGENRVQEAQAKYPGLKAGDPGLTLHLIGPLQTNKLRDALDLFDVIETLDRPRLAEALAREAQRLGRQPRLYVEVNTGEEPQKAGVIPSEADAFIARCRSEYGLELEGLMCIPPADEAPGPHFALTAKLAARNGLAKLSMGMSADYEIAVGFGATSVRVGTALFGARGAAREASGATSEGH